jgi:hypothetical protein
MENKDTLQRLVHRIEAHQKALGLTDQKFVARYSRFLNSERTWRQRLVGNVIDAKKPDEWINKQISKLTAFVSELDGGSAKVEFFEDLPFVKKVLARLAILQGTTTDRRCLMVLATTGVGKSILARNEFEQSPRENAYVRANESWRDKNYQIAAGMGRVLGVDIAGYNPVQSITDFLKKEPITIFIDEAHEGGVALMKLMRTWIDETPVRFVYLAFPTQFDRIIHSTSGNMAEAKQLFGRTLKPVFDDYREGLAVEDIAVYLKKAAGLNGQAKAIAEKILIPIRDNGNLRVLADAVEEARAIAEDREEDLSGPHILEAVEALCPSRKVQVGK